jgi:hypothetical protein
MWMHLPNAHRKHLEPLNVLHFRACSGSISNGDADFVFLLTTKMCSKHIKPLALPSFKKHNYS